MMKPRKFSISFRHRYETCRTAERNSAFARVYAAASADDYISADSQKPTQGLTDLCHASLNPNGIQSVSPELRVRELPWVRRRKGNNPERVASPCPGPSPVPP